LDGTRLVAADTSFAYDLLLRAGHDNNLTLRPENEIDTPRTTAGVTARLSSETERSAISADLEYQSLRFENVPASNSDDYYIDIAASQIWERWSASINAGFSSTNTLRTAAIDTGTPEIGIQRERRALSPSLQFNASETTYYTLAASAEAVEFPDATSFVDYDYTGAQLLRTQALSSRLSWFVGMTYNELESPAVNSISKTAGLQAGIEWQIAQGLKLTANTGRFRVETTRQFSIFGITLEQTDESDGWTADAELEKRWERTRFVARLANNVQPSGNGFLNTQLSGRLVLFHEFSSRFRVRAGYFRYRFDTLSLLDGRPDDRDYQRASLQLDYRVTERLDLSLEAAHTIQTFDRTGETAYRDTIFASFIYRGGRQ
ncbi:MAG: hypothetical protein AAFX10_08970, partial [Pseudomonadota bacterium]